MTSCSKYDLLIEPGELLNFSGDNLKIFDCRADLSDTDLGYKKFLESHISKSQYLSLEKDLSRNPGNRGRHPLPTKKSWINTIRSFGIDNSDQVVLYDETGAPLQHAPGGCLGGLVTKRSRCLMAVGKLGKVQKVPDLTQSPLEATLRSKALSPN